MRIKTLVNTAIFFIGFVLLVGLVLPGVIAREERAKVDRTMTNLGLLEIAVKTYFSDINEYPSALEALVINTEQKDHWHGPYVENALMNDGWGHRFRYECGETFFRIESFGKRNRPERHYQELDLAIRVDLDE